MSQILIFHVEAKENTRLGAGMISTNGILEIKTSSLLVMLAFKVREGFGRLAQLHYLPFWQKGTLKLLSALEIFDLAHNAPPTYLIGKKHHDP